MMARRTTSSPSRRTGWIGPLKPPGSSIPLPSCLFLVGILFVVLMLVHSSITISRLHRMNKKMEREVALLKEEDPGKTALNTALGQNLEFTLKKKRVLFMAGNF